MNYLTSFKTYLSKSKITDFEKHFSTLKSSSITITWVLVIRYFHLFSQVVFSSFFGGWQVCPSRVWVCLLCFGVLWKQFPLSFVLLAAFLYLVVFSHLEPFHKCCACGVQWLKIFLNLSIYMCFLMWLCVEKNVGWTCSWPIHFPRPPLYTDFVTSTDVLLCPPLSSSKSLWPLEGFVTRGFGAFDEMTDAVVLLGIKVWCATHPSSTKSSTPSLPASFNNGPGTCRVAIKCSKVKLLLFTQVEVVIKITIWVSIKLSTEKRK